MTIRLRHAFIISIIVENISTRDSSSPSWLIVTRPPTNKGQVFLFQSLGTSAPNSLNGLFRAGFVISSIGGLSISTGLGSLDNSQLSSFAVNSPTTFSLPSNSCDGSGLCLIKVRRYLRRQKMSVAKAARKARPPSMPPTMAPVGDREVGEE